MCWKRSWCTCRFFLFFLGRIIEGGTNEDRNAPATCAAGVVSLAGFFSMLIAKKEVV